MNLLFFLITHLTYISDSDDSDISMDHSSYEIEIFIFLDSDENEHLAIIQDQLEALNEINILLVLSRHPKIKNIDLFQEVLTEVKNDEKNRIAKQMGKMAIKRVTKVLKSTGVHKATIKSTGKVLKKIAGPLGYTVEIFEIGTAVCNDLSGNKENEGGCETVNTVLKVGFETGCSVAGATIGSAVPVVGTYIGGIAGGVIGSIITSLFSD